MSRPVAAICAAIAVFAAVVFYDADVLRGPAGVTDIVYWTGWTGHELEVQKNLVAEFNRTHPGIRVRILSVAGSYQKVKIAFATGAVPDVCSAVWSHELAGYAFRGVVEPLDKYMAASGRSGQEFMLGVWKGLNYEGRPYALCATTNSAFIVINRSVFRQCGLDPDNPPRTISELDRAVAAVTQYNDNGDFVRYGFRPTWLENWAYVFGGRWYDEESGRITANHPANVACLRWMASYSKTYDIGKMQAFEQSFGNSMSANGSFFTGKQVIMISGEWVKEHIGKYAPGMDWGYFPFPSPPGGLRDFTPVGGSVFVIPAASKHKQAAWEFLDWICSPKAVKEFCLSVGNLPPLKAVAAEPEFQDDPLLKFATGLTGGPGARGAVPIPIWAQYQQEIARVEDYAVHGRRDAQALLDQLTVKMQKELDRVEGRR